jgi:hypothetical protein
MPTKQELNQKYTNIFISDIDDSNIQIAKIAKLPITIKNYLSSMLGNMPSISLSDNKKYTHYLIKGIIKKATYDHKFKAGHYAAVYENGIYYRKYIKSAMQYTSCINGNIIVYTTKKNKKIKSIPFNHCKEYEKIVSTKYEVESDDSFIQSMTMQAISNISYHLKNLFAKKGYIFDAKINADKDLILKTTLGKQYGGKEGLSIDIYKKNKVFHKLSTSKIAHGIMSNIIEDDYSYVIVEDYNKNMNISIGDYIKINYKGESLFSF